MKQILEYEETAFHVGVVFGLSKNYDENGRLKNPKKVVKLDSYESFNSYFKDRAFMAGKAVCDIEEVVVLKRKAVVLEDEKTEKRTIKYSEYKKDEEESVSKTLYAKSILRPTKEVKEEPKANVSLSEFEAMKLQLEQLTKMLSEKSEKPQAEEKVIEEPKAEQDLGMGLDLTKAPTRGRRKNG